ncbi:hypothetical protein K2W90_01535 [Candidatus Babeliales bacterium]|nr:hypothetical protein [Candidatus Babeliales bacterium]
MNSGKKKITQILLTITLLSASFASAKRQPEAEWTVVTYIQADNSLAPFALKNIQTMQQAGLKNKINILVHWNMPENKKIVRYLVTKNALIEDKDIKVKTYEDHEKSLVDTMKWAATNYPAKKYMLNFWNHGSGIIDRVNYLKGRSQLRTHWLETPGLEQESAFRGILYSDTNHTYLDNQQLARSLEAITLTLGKKIDVIGMDACFMAMLEIGYQIKDYAKVLVASQNSEPGRGWNYAEFLNKLSKEPHLVNAQKLGKHIVNAYQKLYAGDVNFYTQSAINLRALDPIKENINQLVACLEHCKNLNEKKIRKAIQTASNITLKFHMHDFVDLHSFYTALLKATSKRSLYDASEQRTTTGYTKALKKLRATLQEGLATINQAVYTSAAAPTYNRARGISIYLPRKKIHHSYPKTMFAQESLWLHFLETFFCSQHAVTSE